MTENKGLAIEEMLRGFIIPFLKKQMNNSKEITATLASYDITKLDARYIKNYANKETNRQLKEMILNGEPIDQDQQALMTASNAQSAQTALQEQGGQRFFAPSELSDKTWKEVLKDLEWDVECDITNENLDKDALTTLNTMLLTLAKNPGIRQDPKIQLLWNKMLELTGAVSTIELNSVPQAPPVQPATQIAPIGGSTNQLIQPLQNAT
jgi:hypothetical protein